MKIGKLWALVLAAGLWACVDESYDTGPVGNAVDAGTISFLSDPMQMQRVTSRASDGKNDDEKRINTLHVFFFDENGEYLEGTYLEGYPGATEKGGYYAPSEGVTVLKIANDVAENFNGNQAGAEKATVYAVANVDASFFEELDGNGRPVNVPNMRALEALTYAPSEGISLGLPAAGMPMIGHKTIDLTSTADPGDSGVAEERTVLLKALMSRVDVSVNLASEVGEGNLPAMTLVEWTAMNLPTKVAFAEPSEGGTTGWAGEEWNKDITTSLQRTIYNRNGEITFSFYMFENMQAGRNDYSYPTDVYNPDLGIDKRQNYKPFVGVDTANSAAVRLHAYYSTYNEDGSGSSTYDVRYTLYLGANHTDNFEVKRNHQYKNDITITGLTAQAAVEGGKYTFDARVNVDEDENEYYIAMLRERNHDAHFCVTPMDVWLFADASKQPTMEVILGEVPENSETPTEGTVPDWIRMEKVPASDMQAGTVANSDKQLVAGGNFTAGHGKRKWFTTSLLSELSSKVTLDASRDRIYFYLDENLVLQDRTATVTLIYKEDGKEVRRRTVQIGQTHLLPVQMRDGGTVYMEQYEEYLDHYDPLNEYQNEQIYTGLPWAVEGTTLANMRIEQLYEEWNITVITSTPYDKPGLVINDGNPYTSFIIDLADQKEMDLNDKPLSAFQYCHNRNKRDSNGEIPASYVRRGLGSYYVEETNESKWFLPGIRQMEDALVQYYTTFPEFQENYYWSSSAGEREGTADAETTSATRARATMVTQDGNYIESGGGNETGSWREYAYELGNGGYALRTESLRIRAFRVDLNPVNY